MPRDFEQRDPYSRFHRTKLEFLLQLFLLMVAVCEAGRITRGVIHGPNYQAVYHGHGATSYQSMQVDHHGGIIVPTNYKDQAELLRDYEHHEPIVPVVKTFNDVDHLDISDSGNSRQICVHVDA